LTNSKNSALISTKINIKKTMTNKNWFWRIVIGVIMIASLYVSSSSKDLPEVVEMAMTAGY